MTMWKRSLVTMMTAVAVSVPASSLLAQAEKASVHGHVINAIGQPVTTGDVKFTTDKAPPSASTKYEGTYPLDASGNYTGAGLTPGDYVVYVMAEGKTVDRLQVVLKAGDNKTLDFDMTRAEYYNALSPEAKKEIEEYKKKNAETMQANQTINNLNATLKTVRADLAAAAPTKADVSKDVSEMKQATEAKPDASLLWITYGDSLVAQADHMAAEDKKAGKAAQTDADVNKEYADGADAYKKGVDVETASKKPTAATIAVADNQMGNAYAKAGKSEDASTAFEAAAKANPTAAGVYYKNEAAVLFNNNQNDAALAAAEKAIQTNPQAPDPYFIKGQVLVAKSTFDAKTQKLVAPAGCVEAYQKYLELAPNGAQAGQVKEVLASLGATQQTKFKAGKKS